METIKLKLIPIKDLYPKTISNYRIYSCITNDHKAPVKLNAYGNFVIVGEMPELIIGQEYVAEIQEFKHKVYGITYNLLTIRQDIPKTAEGQYAFLRTIISENYVDAIQQEYPNEINIIEKIINSEIDYSQIRGVGDTVFKRIRQAVIDNIEIQDALVALSPLGVSHRVIQKLINHYKGNVSMLLEKIKQNIYILCNEVSGLGFDKVDGYAIKSGVPVDSPHRINACIEYMLRKEEDNGHCWIERDELIEKVMKKTDLEYKIISNHLKSKYAEEFYQDEWRIGLKRNYNYEKAIVKHLVRLLKNPVKTKVDNLEERIKQIESVQGFLLTDEQKNAVKTCIENNVIIVSGKAGSGKTTVLKSILEVLKDYTYETCSLSGKAAQRIIEATGLTSKTIHRLLGYKNNSNFVYNSENKLPYDIIVLDEASMVNNKLFYHLISAIDDGGKFIILGDVEQLPPIGCGAVLIDLINSGAVPVCRLTKVHRQAQKSGILTYANKIREGIQINDRGDYKVKTVGELQDLVLIPFRRDERDKIAPTIIDLCKRVKNRINLLEFQVIVPMKGKGLLSTKTLNTQLQEIFNPNKQEGIKRNGYEFKIGDKVIKRGNDYDNDVHNGTLGFIEWINIHSNTIGIKFVGKEEVVEYSKEELNDIELAYALTTHSNQGSQYENGICALDFTSYVLLSRQHVYTMLSRYSKKCMFLFENEALRYAIDNNETVMRNTFLPELLAEIKNEI